MAASLAGPTRLLCSIPVFRQKRAFRVAVIGSGPAGFYFSGALLRKVASAQVDLYERQPVPFGLARFGVAPDHPEVKNCIHQFETYFTGDTQSRINFLGNIAVGHDVSMDELRAHYDAVVCAYGAEGENKMGIPGEDLRNSVTARSFVGWYNGLPEMQQLDISLDTDHAVVVGAGNVALDTARILLSGVDRLRTTDINERTLHALSTSRIRRVTLVARRGPLQVAFTIKELREQVNLPGCTPVLDDFFVHHPDGLTAEQIKQLPRPRQRLVKLMQDAAAGRARKITEKDKLNAWHMVFMRSPVSLSADASGSSVGAITLAHNRYIDDVLHDLPNAEKAKIEATDTTSQLECGLVLSSIGYRSVAMPGLPFDARYNVLPTETDGTSVKDCAGVYATGWCAVGPVGVIATTQTQAAAAAHLVAKHLDKGTLTVDASKGGCNSIEQLLNERDVDWVSWPGWLRVDAREKQLGEKDGRPRHKLTKRDDIMRLVHDD